MALPGIGFTRASWMAYSTMNGVMMPGVSAGSNQVGRERHVRRPRSSGRPAPESAAALCPRRSGRDEHHGGHKGDGTRSGAGHGLSSAALRQGRGALAGCEVARLSPNPSPCQWGRGSVRARLLPAIACASVRRTWATSSICPSATGAGRFRRARCGGPPGRARSWPRACISFMPGPMSRPFAPRRASSSSTRERIPRAPRPSPPCAPSSRVRSTPPSTRTVTWIMRVACPHFSRRRATKGWPTPSIVGHRNIAGRFDRYRLTAPWNGLINSRQFSTRSAWPTDYDYPTVVYDTDACPRGGRHAARAEPRPRRDRRP